MINLKLELQNFPRIDTNTLPEGTPDNVKSATILYNKALDNLHSNSEDIAIIELKKAISMDANFYQAINLLGICYGYIGEYTKASEMFEKVANAQNDGVKAMSFLSSINFNDVPPGMGEGKKKSKPIKNEKQVIVKEAKKPEPRFDSFTKADIIKYSGGFIIGAVIVFLISLPFYFADSDSTPVTNSNPTDEGTTQVNTELKALEEKYNALNTNFDNLKKDKKDNDAEIDYYKNVVKLFDIENLSAVKKYEQAADNIIMLKDIDFKDSEKKKYDSLKKDILPKAAWAVYNEGNNLLYSKKYQDALYKLSKVQTYGTAWAYMDSTLYNIGVCYKQLNDSKSALDTFKKLKNSYPKSQYTIYAQARINEITGTP